eukprot:TRINITY_DN5749_c0_g1_i1.p1 TRINITY_DN5749_c0_g1~~TRINITY_DN5749_c0_g1_i1.p1  ORF type:complete len:126 (-),score=24.89 TRINITY_DN5749_c0_g1_i1:12-389(-)
MLCLYIKTKINTLENSRKGLISQKLFQRGERDKLNQLFYGYDSDEDFVDHKFEKDEVVDFYLDGTGWQPAKVLDTLEEMIHLKLAQDQNQWVVFDCEKFAPLNNCLLYTSPSPRDRQKSRMPSSA